MDKRSVNLSDLYQAIASQWGTLKVSGPNAEKFLQGQLTCDVSLNEIQLGAYCNVQGRVQSLFFLRREENNFFLHMPPDILENTFSLLQKYGRFSKVTLEIIPHDPQSSTSDGINWQEKFIEAKLPWITSETIGIFTPQELNLDQAEAVSFTKGCYIGQEIVARMHYRGKGKRRLQRLMLKDTALPSLGQPFTRLESETPIVLVNAVEVSAGQYDVLVVAQSTD